MDNNDFEIVGRISIDDTGSVKLEATNKELQQIENQVTMLSKAMSKLGEIANYVFGELMVQAVLNVIGRLQTFMNDSVQAAVKHQQIMAQFDSVIASTNAALDKGAAATDKYTKTQGALVTVTVGSAKEIAKTQKALDKAKQSLDAATASYDSHAKHTASSTIALQNHQAKVADLQAQYDKLTKTMQVAANTTDGVKRTVDKNAAAITMSKDQLLALADAYSKTTTYSKDMQIQAETTILQFDRIGKDVFPSAMQAAEDLASRYNIDLSQAAEYVARALGDPAASVGTLQRQFQLFEPTQLRAIENLAKQGKTAEAQKAILDALSTSIAGSATAAASTFAGKMAIFNNQLEEAKIKIGDALIPVLSQLMDKLGPLADKVLPLFSEAFTKFLLPALTFVVGKAGEFLDWLTKAGGPIDTVRKALSDLVTKGLQALGDWWAQNGPGVTKFISDLGAAIATVPNTLGTIANGLKAIFLDAFSKIDPATLDKVQQFIVKLAKGLQDIPNTVSGIADNLKVILVWIGQNVVPSVLAKISDFLINLGNAIRAFPNTVATIAIEIEAFALTLRDLGEKMLAVDPRALGYLATGFLIIGTTLTIMKIPVLIGNIVTALGALGTAIIPAVIAAAPLIGVFIVISAIVLAAATNFHGFGDALQTLGDRLRKLPGEWNEWATELGTILAQLAINASNTYQALWNLVALVSGHPELGGLHIQMKPGLVAQAGLGAGGGGGAGYTGTRAKGGPVIRGEPYLVGEMGPELFVPESHGTIVPNQSKNSVVNNYYFGSTLYNPSQGQGQNLAQAFRKS